MSEIALETWGEHEALLLKPPRSPLSIPPPIPRTAVLFPRREGFYTELGGYLPEVRLRFETYGRLNARRDNAVLVFHALTGSAHLAGTYEEKIFKALPPLEQAFGREGWWDALVGPGRILDPALYYVISANHLGSCYGSTGPLSPDPRTGKPYGRAFPPLTIRDLARAQARLLDHLGVERATVIGGSLGGMVALEFALMYPERVNKLVVLAAPPRHGPWAQAFNHLARQAILQDPGYWAGEAAPKGMALARGIAMMSYRAPEGFAARWSEAPEAGPSYLDYQGEKFLRRFHAESYLVLSRAMDTHDVGRGRGGVEAALKRLREIPSLFVGIDTDLLYPAWEVREAAKLAGARYREIRSPHGHDAFLIETDQVEEILDAFLP
ncbi:homoserine O-acetyltransferase [Thermus sp.]|uniref:homoserine O-acetyltransferase MetX n=1 Tax=Thermus sp. TaxID=275 RepID=UPI00307E686D